MARALFTDGSNSAWHAAFGAMAHRIGLAIWVPYLIYQLDGNENQFVDITEFLIGYSAMSLVQLASLILPH